MLTQGISKLVTRVLMAVMILGIVAMALPQPVSAAYPTFSIVSVKADDTVTVRTNDFPKNILFTVRMDVLGNRAENGVIAGSTNSGIGGNFDVTYKIPASLKGQKWIAIRFESEEGYYSYNWFFNNTSVTTPKPIPVTGTKPFLTFTGVKANETVMVEGRNLPANTILTVRVGPYYTFFSDYVTTPSVKTDANGSVSFSIKLPSVVKNVERITVRLDGGGHYAYNAFINVDGGTTIPVTSTGSCQVVSVAPSASLSTNAEFDAAWTIKNTSSKTWDGGSVDFKYVSGSEMQKYEDRYDLHQNVKSGETVKIVVDMKAPASTGYYTTRWALVQGSTTICSLPLTVRVR